MSTHRFLRSTCWLSAVVASALFTTAVRGAGPASEARLDAFAKPDGSSAFALSLKPAAQLPVDAGGRDVVVVFDTSATQVGDYRTTALAALNGLLGKLQPQDRVRLIGADVQAQMMDDAFAAPGSAPLTAALQKLQKGAPLGAMDIEVALKKAIDAFGNSPNAKEIVFIGQGRSPANMLSPEQLAALVGALVQNRIAVNSFAIGPHGDLQLLGALAANTGGNVVADGAVKGDAQEAARQLAAVVRATVYWPAGELNHPPAITEMFPTMPPLRTDRDTVLVGTLKGSQPMELKLTVVTPKGPEELSWTVPPAVSNPDNSYLVQLVDLARRTNGIAMPTVSSEYLKAAATVGQAGQQTLSQLARQALAAGNNPAALLIAEEALRRDPNDPEAAAIKRQAGQGGAPNAAPAPAAAPAAADLNLVGTPPPPPGGAAVQAFEQERRVIAQVAQADVQNAINRARALMGTNPAEAIQSLRVALESIRNTHDLNPDVSQQLVDALQSALQEGRRRQFEEEQRRQQAQELQAAARERRLLAENFLRNEQKAKQLIDRYDALMAEGRYRQAEEEPALAFQKLKPNTAVSVAATIDARQTANWQASMEIRTARFKGYFDTMTQVEKSHIPFPDDPPIVYPPAEVWQQLTAARKEKYKEMDLASTGPAEKKIQAALRSPTSLEFVDTPLNDVLEYLKEVHGIEIQIDKKALEDAGVQPDVPVTKNLKGVSLRSALRLLLKDLDLTYIIDSEVLLITTQEKADAKLTTKVYPVADLVISPQRAMESTIMAPRWMNPEQAFMGSVGGGGGMGGGMGGMGGMGGGGMGGGMGGMMGGMGGGMGGGMFNLPVEKLPEFKAFAVQDDLTLAPAAQQPAAVKQPAAAGAVNAASDGDNPAADQKPAAKVTALPIPQGADPEAAWDKYFTANTPAPAAVRETVRQLLDKGKHQQIIALIWGALRHGQPQPWMYEALGLSMELSNHPRDEVERAIMSAADFAQSPIELMYLGAYLQHNNMHARALKIFREVALMQPLATEPYTLGMKSAQAVNDLDGIQWAAVGIIRQAWTKDQADIYQSALRVARATLEELKAAKRSPEYLQFKAAIDEASLRDVVVEVKWNGDADLDLMVQEPAGTVCSVISPRTASGGVLVGDSTSAQGRQDLSGAAQESYVCPEAFSGTYRVLVRRAWGKVVANRVQVQVTLHQAGKHQMIHKETLPLDKEGCEVVFTLKDGRRKESLDQQQVVNAVAGQMAVNQQILAQQLNAAVDPDALAAFAQSRVLADVGTNGGLNGSGGGVVPFPYPMLQGAVGYMPIIAEYPVGLNFSVTAVVSADRRYVRVTEAPLFSNIPVVHTFNYVGGTGSTQAQ